MNRTHKNPLHLDNFTTPGDAFEINAIMHDAVNGQTLFTIATGRTVDEAKERFYMRYALRAAACVTEREIIERAQTRGNLVIQEIRANHRTLIERNPFLIVML